MHTHSSRSTTKSGCPRSRFGDLGKLNPHPATPKACTELVEVAIRRTRSPHAEGSWPHRRWLVTPQVVQIISRILLT